MSSYPPANYLHESLNKYIISPGDLQEDTLYYLTRWNVNKHAWHIAGEQAHIQVCNKKGLDFYTWGRHDDEKICPVTVTTVVQEQYREKQLAYLVDIERLQPGNIVTEYKPWSNMRGFWGESMGWCYKPQQESIKVTSTYIREVQDPMLKFLVHNAENHPPKYFVYHGSKQPKIVREL